MLEDGEILFELMTSNGNARDNGNRSRGHPERSEQSEEGGRPADQLEGGEDDGEKPWGGEGGVEEEQEQHHP